MIISLLNPQIQVRYGYQHNFLHSCASLEGVRDTFTEWILLAALVCSYICNVIAHHWQTGMKSTTGIHKDYPLAIFGEAL